MRSITIWSGEVARSTLVQLLSLRISPVLLLALMLALMLVFMVMLTT
jgi:hypothetical protein